MTRMKLCFLALTALALSLVAAPALAMTGYAWIDNSPEGEPYYLEEDCAGVGWSWNASEDKLTLNSLCVSYIFIECDDENTDVVNIEVVGDVTLSSGDHGAAIGVNGSINLSGTGTLTIVPSARASQYSIPTIRASHNLTISGATLIVPGNRELNTTVVAERVALTGNARLIARANGERGYAVYAAEDLLIGGNAQVWAEGYGPNSAGILAASGDVTVNDNASLVARSQGMGYAVEITQGALAVNNGNVTLYADDEEHFSNTSNEGTGEIATEINEQDEEEEPQEETQETKSNASSGGCDAGLGALAVFALFMGKRR